MPNKVDIGLWNVKKKRIANDIYKCRTAVQDFYDIKKIKSCPIYMSLGLAAATSR